MDISVVIPTYNEGGNIKELIENIKIQLSGLCIDYEILIIDGGSKDGTVERSKEAGAKVIMQSKKGYGNALIDGITAARGDYIITMDGDFSHDPVFMQDLWNLRNKMDIIIASRYVKGGNCEISGFRLFLSVMLNRFFAWGLAIPLKDLSSGYRLYKSSTIKNIDQVSRDFDVLQDIIVRAYSNGWRVTEIPFQYKIRKTGQSKLRLLNFGVSYLRTFHRLWLLRTSIDSVDYDYRSFESRIPLQKYWHNQRKKVIMDFLDPEERVLDIGCGTSKIIYEVKNGVGLDKSMGKLRYLKGKKIINDLVCGDARKLPFKDNSFSQSILSSVIQSVNESGIVLHEAKRILKNDGVFILGSPDFGRVMWKLIEPIYNIVKFGSKYSYSRHIVNRFKRKDIEQLLKDDGFVIIDPRYVFLSELIIKCNNIK